MIEKAIMLVPEFENVVRKLEQQVTLRGQSKSTLNNRILRIAMFVIHFGKLPVILNYRELRELFAAPALLKQRIVLTLIYSAGLRGQEVLNLKISDIDTSTSSVQVLNVG